MTLHDIILLNNKCDGLIEVIKDMANTLDDIAYSDCGHGSRYAKECLEKYKELLKELE